MRAALFVLLLLFSFQSYSQEPGYVERLSYFFNREFESIAFDVRSTRGGNGDVAAAYLTAMDLITRWNYRGRITFIVNNETIPIVERLSKNNNLFQSAVRIEDFESEKFTKESFDLLFVLASNDNFIYKKRIVPRERQPNDRQGIYVKRSGVIIAQTVLGDTEFAGDRPAGLVVSEGRHFLTNIAGVADNQAGTYTDYVARELREKNELEVDAFLNKELEKLENENLRKTLQDLVAGDVIPNSRLGLVYGITARSVKMQFELYLKGLYRHYKESKEKIILITPSKFDPSDLHKPELIRQVKKIPLDDSTLENIRKSKERILVIETPTLPHSVFVGLMAKSNFQGIIPLGSGDGFTSGAIELGRPFALTGVRWNWRNIQLLRKSLQQSASSKFSGDPRLEQALRDTYGGGHIESAYHLLEYAEIFSGLRKIVPELSERLLNAAVNTKAIFTTTEPIVRVIGQTTDPVLRYSFFRNRSDIEKARTTSVKSGRFFGLNIPEMDVTTVNLDIYERIALRFEQFLEMLKEALYLSLENDLERFIDPEGRRGERRFSPYCQSLFL